MSRKQSKYSYILYSLIKCMHVDSNTQYTSKWINMIEDTLIRTGLGPIWLLGGSIHNTECMKDRLQLILNYIFKQECLKITGMVGSNSNGWQQHAVTVSVPTTLYLKEHWNSKNI